MRLSGWILDVYPSAGAMTIWLIDDNARTHRLADSFTASFFAYGSHSDLHDLCLKIRTARLPVQNSRTSGGTSG